MEKKKQLLHLLSNSEILTAKQLATRLQVSVRTVKNYIYQLNEEFPTAILSSNKGYELNREIDLSTELISPINNTKEIPQSAKERISFIVRLLLQSQLTDSFNVYDVADRLYVSESTVRNDLKKVKAKIRKCDLNIRMHGDNFQLLGTEQNKRRMFSSIIYEESDTKFISIASLKALFPEIDVNVIRSIVQIVFQENHYFINDYCLTNLVLHLALSIERIKQTNHHILQQVLDQQDTADYQIAFKIANQLENAFEIEFSNAEIYEIALLIASRATTLNFETITNENIETFVGKKCLEMSRQLISKIHTCYSIDLSHSEFFVRFTLHLHNLSIRSQNNYLSKNPLTQEIKLAYPLIYDIAVNLSEDIISKYHITLNDDEIAFIAFHIGSILEMQKENQQKLATVIFCPEYYDLGIKLSTKLTNLYTSDLIIKDIITDIEAIQKMTGIDLIISTVPVVTLKAIPVFEVGMFLSQVLKEKLDRKVKEIHKAKEKLEIRKMLMQLIAPDLFENQRKFTDRNDCIHYMVDKFIQKGYVDHNFEDEIRIRESLSSTAFGNFAIPHSMKMEAKKTGLNIVLSSNGISWDTHKVNLVMMMCFNQNERYIFNQLYETITMLLSDANNFTRILDSTSYDDFIDKLVDCI